MKLIFAPKEPGKAYVSNSLWLPKSVRAGDGLVRVDPVKQALEFTLSTQAGKQTLQLWDETQNHLICPREFLPPSQYEKYRFDFVDLRPEFSHVPFEDWVTTRNEEQEKAWRALSANDNGILNLSCGKGKTMLALKKVAHRKTPTLIIVPDGGILEQWKESILGNAAVGRLPALGFNGELGFIQGPVFNWAHPITLALVTTLWKRIEDGTFPEEAVRYFGLIIWDEAHRIGAPKFSLTASHFYGDRLGLTATVQREDGLDPVYRYHIGEPFYTDISQDLIPEIYFQRTPADIDLDKGRTEDGKINIGLLRTALGKDLVGNTFRYWHIKAAADEGRKILVLSHSIAQLKLMHSLFPGSGLIIGKTNKQDRMRILRESRICFAIAKLGSEGIDDDSLDLLFWLTPFRSLISLQQSMGRIQRQRPGKSRPVMVFFEDTLIVPLKQMCTRLKLTLREWALDFTILNPQRFADIPDELRRGYESVLTELTGEEEDDGD